MTNRNSKSGFESDPSAPLPEDVINVARRLRYVIRMGLERISRFETGAIKQEARPKIPLYGSLDAAMAAVRESNPRPTKDRHREILRKKWMVPIGSKVDPETGHLITHYWAIKESDESAQKPKKSTVFDLEIDHISRQGYPEKDEETRIYDLRFNNDEFAAWHESQVVESQNYGELHRILSELYDIYPKPESK